MPVAPGSLGSLYVMLSANSVGLVKGMKTAEATVATSSVKMAAQARALALGVTGSLAVIGTAAVVQFSKFDKAMTKSLAIMGDVSQNLRDEMATTARQLATESTTSAEKLADAYFYLASAGLNAEQSIGALDTVNTFAIAGQFDMARATDLLTDAQSALGLTVKDTAQNMENMTAISDVLVKANTLANATVEQFSTALTREAGAAMKSFNIDIEEGVAVLAAFADQGVKGEIAGSGLSRVLRLMTTAAVKNASAYKELGIEVFDSTGNLNNLADIIADIEVAFGGMSDEQRVAALDMLGFKARVQGVILPLLGTSEKIRDYETSLRQAGGTTDEVATKQMQNFIDQLTITWHRIEDIFITIGEQLTPALQALNAMWQDSIGTANDMNDAMGGFMQNVGPAFVATIGTIGDAIWGLKLAYHALAAGVQAQMGIVLKVMITAASVVEAQINKMIRAFNAISPKDIPLLKVAEGINLFADSLLESSKESIDKMEELAAQESFSTRLLAGYEKVTKGVEEENKKIVADVKSTTEQVKTAFETASISLATEQINTMFGQAFGDSGVPGRLAAPQTGDAASFEIESIRQQQSLAQENLAILEDIQNQEVELTQRTQEKKIALMEAYTEQVRALQAAQAHIILNSAENMFSDLSQIAGAFAGEQSGVYKAMFAMSKAFAIADATVKIAQGIASAASLPFPSNIPAMASVVAATASIISNIQSVQLTFGGEREMGGPVEPGKTYLVGEAGPELFSPGSAGNITANDKLGTNVKVIVNNHTDAQATVTESETGDGKTIEVMIKRVKNELAAEVREGRGDLNRSIQSSYGLNRKGSR